jgi:RHS repeat-associated protein
MMTRDDSAAPREFVYTADDERIATYTVGSSWRWTVRNRSGKVLREFSSQDGAGGPGTGSWKWEKDHVWRDGLLLASRQPEGVTTTTYHYHLDHLGTPRRVTDQYDRIVGVHDYFAFGPETAGGTPERSLTTLKYTGHERDSVMGSESSDTLDYMHARYYSPISGRFLSVDPVLGDPRVPQSWNRYAYVQNNPLRYTDPTGTSLWETLIRVVRYIGRDEKVVARIHEVSKSKAMKRVEQGIKAAREEKATSIAVVTETKEARNAVGKQLAESKKIRPPEKSGIWPEHVNPADGPNADIHVQTVADTKSAGFGKSLGMGLLAIIGANTMTANENKDATVGEVAGAFAWDTAKAIDPLFITDAIEHFSGIGDYSEQSDSKPPE